MLDRQIKDGLDRLTAEQVAELVVAYEPVWAIGTGRNATRRAGRGGARAHPRARLRQWFGADAAEHCHVHLRRQRQAGQHRASSIAEPDVDGALVGGASLEMPEFRGHRDAEPAGCAIIGVSGNQDCSMLYYLLTTLYVFVCLVLLLVILLQQGKGGDMASAFGGGSSQTAFGARGGATLLSKATAVLAALFMLGAMVLSVMGQRGPGSLLRGTPGPAPAPITAPAPTPPAATTPPATTTAPGTTPPATTPPATPPQQPR